MSISEWPRILMTGTTVAGNFAFQLEHVQLFLWLPLLFFCPLYCQSRHLQPAYSNVLKYSQILSTDWMKLVKREGRNICMGVCPPIMQAFICPRSILTAQLPLQSRKLTCLCTISKLVDGLHWSGWFLVFINSSILHICFGIPPKPSVSMSN